MATFTVLTTTCFFLPLTCGGYVAGGLAGSSTNHLVWNERAARAGAFLGTAVHAVAVAVFLGVHYSYLIPEAIGVLKTWWGTGWLWNTIIGSITWLDVIGTSISIALGDPVGSLYSIANVGIQNPVPFFVSAPEIVGKTIFKTFYGIKDQYEAML